MAGQRRPAVILGIVAIPFLFDWTFQTETFSTLGEVGILASFVWVALIPIKLGLLVWSFRLRVNAIFPALATLAASAVAAMPHLMSGGVVDPETLQLGSVWLVAALAAVAMMVRSKASSSERLDAWGQTVLRRTLRTAGVMWAGLYLVHAGAWMLQFDLDAHPLLAVPLLLLLPFLIRHESFAWLGMVAAVIASTWNPLTVAPTAAVAGLLFVLHAYHLRQKRLFVGAVLSFHAAIWTIGWQVGLPPDSILALNLITASVLLLLAWKGRLKTAVLAAVLVLLPIAPFLVPGSTLEWGIATLAVGFVALVVGVAINWRQRTDPRSLT